MVLPGKVREIVNRALSSAFPGESDLDLFLRHKLDIELPQIKRRKPEGRELYDYTIDYLNSIGKLRVFLDTACQDEDIGGNAELKQALEAVTQLPELMGPLPRLGSLADLAEKADSTCRQLVDALRERRWKDTFLFGSNKTDTNHSITVSSMAMLALVEAGDRMAQFVCDAVLEDRQREGANAGAWRAQGNEHYHTVNAAWAVFACLRTRPSCARELAASVEWLIGQQDNASGGWPYLHRDGNNPRAFYTAYVMSALVEYLQCAKVAGSVTTGVLDTTRVSQALSSGLRFLTEAAPSTRNPQRLLWSQYPRADDVCIATTAMATHVLAKVKNVVGLAPLIEAQLPQTLELLAEYLENGPGKTTIDVDGVQVPVDPWPSFDENDPAYWYYYFTPIAGVTVMDTARDLGLSDVPSAMRAVVSTVKWVLEKTVTQADKMPGVPKSVGDKRIANWTTAQGIIILRRWQVSLSSLVRQPQTLSLFDTEPASSSTGALESTAASA